MIRIFVVFPIKYELAESFLLLSKKNSFNQNVRWTPRANLHITLFFIGEIEEENLNKIKNSLGNILQKQHSFSLSFEKIFFTDSKKRSLMIWGQFKKSEDFRMLSEKIYVSVKELMTTDHVHQDPIPHCTIARIKQNAETLAIDLNVNVQERFSVMIDAAELWQTVQTKEGVKYKSIEKYKFERGK